MHPDKFRCYHFCNMYFPGIHAGIQSHHAFMEIFNKHKNDGESTQWNMLNEWAEDNKTVIALNGGMHSDLAELESFLSNESNPFAWASFREAKDAANEALTNVGIILPDYIFKMSHEIVNNHPIVLSYKGLGDGNTYESETTFIKVVEGGIVVSYEQPDYHNPLVNPMPNAVERPKLSLTNHFYSDFEVEFMARLVKHRLMN